uniref:Cytochrome c domain-containing protein n=1 Tax=Eiseniibacteriota bacterium TaxID=2212470 RepID=A0A832MMB6_UNCEI
MAAFGRCWSLVAVVAVAAIGLTGCERKITRVEVVQEPQSCFNCHSDQNTQLVDAEQQWENSRHSTGSTLNENDSTCKGCHTSEGFIARATGVTAPSTIENPTAIHCFTCHAPHTSGDFRLRWTTVPALANAVSFDLGSGNICAACHQARRNVATYITDPITMSTRFGPHHSNQADMLIGTNGYEYAGYTYNRTSHREATTASGKDGCLECHFKATSQYVVGGHSFNMRAEVHGEEVLNVGACEPCHGPQDDFADIGPGYSYRDSIEILAADLRARLVAANLLDATTGLPRAVRTSRDSAGAVWNYLMVEEDRSVGMHNPAYAKDLLRSSILFLTPPPPLAAHVRGSRD